MTRSGHACTPARQDGLPLDELAGARPEVPGAAFRLVGLELEQVAAERPLEAGQHRLDAVGRVPQRRLAPAGRRRPGLPLPQRSSRRQNASAEASQARNCTISRRALSSLAAWPTRMSGQSDIGRSSAPFPHVPTPR